MISKGMLKSIGLISLVGALFTTSVVFAELKPIDGIAAAVQDKVITTSELDQAVSQYKLGLKGQAQALPEKQLRSEILDHLIDEKVLLMMAQKLQVKVSKKEVDHTIKMMAKEKNQTVDAMADSLSKHGITLKDYKQRVLDQMLLARVQVELLSVKQKPTAEQVKGWLKEHRYDGLAFKIIDWHISNDTMSTGAAKQTAQSWLGILKETKSTDPKVIPGVEKNPMQMTPVSGLPTVFTKAISRNINQDFYGPILADNGYHVLQVIDRRGRVLDANVAYNYMLSQAVERHLPEILKKLRKDAYIQKFNE